MSADCLVISFGTPNTTLSTEYVVKSGDTLVKIAKNHGVADWREIYNHPDNRAFKAKRPNPDKIFPGDVLMIPGVPSDIPPPPLPQRGGGVTGGGGGFGFARMPLLLNPRRPKSSDLDLDFKQPGNTRLRLTLFWVTNCVKIDASPQTLIAKTEEIYSQHGLSLDILPSRQRTPEHTIQFPDLIEQDEYNLIRLEGHRRFNDQKSGDRRQRLPIFFCEFRDPTANGLTIRGDWLPYNFVSGALTADRATMAHEILHAAGLEGHFRGNTTNLMAGPTHERSEMFKFQVQAAAKAYYAR